MSYETINRQDTINLFHELMRVDSGFRVLRMVGDAKVGKTHFVARVFPTSARDEYGARCAVVDLGSAAQTIGDILENACAQLGDESDFVAYRGAYREWMNRPMVQAERLVAIFSWMRIESRADERQMINRQLLSQFVADLRRLSASPLVMLFDAVDKAGQATRDWLMGSLLLQAATVPHVRVVVAGRSLPPASSSYVSICRSCELAPVEDEEEYIVYCEQIGAELDAQTIRHMAHMFDYKPGLFVDFVRPKFGRRGVSSG